MKKIIAVLVFLSFAACAGKKVVTASSAKKDLEDRYNPKIGSATKADFVEYFGTAEWCRPQDNGEEACRFYKKIETKWTGDPTDRKHYDTYDQVMANFDSNGTLKSFKADAVR